MILFAFPPLIAGDLLFEMQRMFDWPFFDAERGGDPLLWQHLFWIFGHPEVYIIFLPAIALMAMIVPTFSQRPIVGYSWIVLAAVGTGFLSFGLWVHHMFATGLPQISLAFFSAASEAVAIPTGVQIFVFIATMLAGRVIFSVPMLFGAGGIAIFVIGGLTGVMVALVPFDWQAHDTYFVVAHLHYVLIGGMLFPLIAGLYYYYPLIDARMLSDAARPHRLLADVRRLQRRLLPDASHRPARHAAPRLHLSRGDRLGLAEPGVDGRRLRLCRSASLVVVFDVVAAEAPPAQGRAEPLERRHAGMAERAGGELGRALHPARREPLSALGPGRTWRARSTRAPTISPHAEEGRRETLITSVLDARATAMPARGGADRASPWSRRRLLGGVFVALTFELWILAALSGVGTLAAILWWLWTGTGEIPEKQTKDVGLGLRLPLYASGPASVGWWAMFITMVGDGTAFASLVFGYFFYWTIHPDFTAGHAGPGLAMADDRRWRCSSPPGRQCLARAG